MDSFLRFPKGTVVIVTGAASGIGQAVAKVAARYGLVVSAWDLSEGGVGATADAIKAEGGTCVPFGLDASNPQAVENAIQQTYQRLGPVSCFASVAGPPSFGKFEFTEAVQQTIDCARVPTETWLRRGHDGPRTAVYVASVQGPRYGAGVQWYTVAKSAVDGYMRSVAGMRQGGLRANAILPDIIATPRTQKYVTATGGNDFPANPMGRVGLPEDVANAALFLLSPASEYINGISLEIDGGSRLRSLGWMRIADVSGSAAQQPHPQSKE
jgi:NAD(P)-dependent dehydrogenase (short-subunit alcohol dehydrogenase family)